jgi:hypothetical protein
MTGRPESGGKMFYPVAEKTDFILKFSLRNPESNWTMLLPNVRTAIAGLGAIILLCSRLCFRMATTPAYFIYLCSEWEKSWISRP